MKKAIQVMCKQSFFNKTSNCTQSLHNLRYFFPFFEIFFFPGNRMTFKDSNCCSITNSSYNNTESRQKDVFSDNEMLDPKYGFFAHIAFGIIAVLSFVGNVLICVVILIRKSLLKKPCNVLILNLAVTDLLTGKKRYGLHFTSFHYF